MFKKVPQNPLDLPETCAATSPTDNERASTPNRRTPTLRTNITSKSQIASRKNTRQYHLTKEDLDFIELYTQHFPRPVHRVLPPSRSKRKRKHQSDVNESELVDQSEGQDGRGAVHPPSGHTYELAKELCKMKERPLAVGIKEQMRLIGALRKLDQDRECAWKCWMQCAMRREAEHINKMRIPTLSTRAQNLQDVGPDWYQQLSWEQMETVNKLEMTLYHDLDEGTTNRTQCLLRVLGLEPPPSHRVIKCVMNNSKDDPCKFLIELYKAVSLHGRLPGEDKLDEENEEEGVGDEPGDGGKRRKYRTGFEYSLDERLILSGLSHLQIGHILHCLDEEFGKPNTHLPYFKMVMPPCQKRRKKTNETSTWPYLQPLHIPEYNWLEPKLIQDAIYAQNLYMTLHRVPPPVPPQLRPVPYTHIQIPEYLKPRRYKSAKARRPSTGGEDIKDINTDINTDIKDINTDVKDTNTDIKDTKTDISGRSHSENESVTIRQRTSKRTLATDTVSLGSKTKYRRNYKRDRCRRKRSRPTVVSKPRRRFLPAWLKRLGESSKMCIHEGSRPSTPLIRHPPPAFPQRPRRNHKAECLPCECKNKKNNQTANMGDILSPSEGSEETYELDSLEVAGFLPGIPEPLAKLKDTVELPAIQKWVRMKNGLVYIHPVIAANLTKRSKALWNILEGGKCSMIQAPELCLTKKEERSLKWDHIGWLRRETNRIVEEYYRTCFEMQVALAREFYPSMATDYFRNRDKFLQIYFTYMPARPQDCFRRPWQKSEYNREIYTRWKKKYQEIEAAKKQEKANKINSK